MFTDEQRAIQDVAKRFATDRIAPGYMAREQHQVIDRGLIREMGALGLIGVDLPERFGGLNAPSVTAGLVIEAVGYADLNVAYVQLLASLNGQILAHHASEPLARFWLPRIVAGRDGAVLAFPEMVEYLNAQDMARQYIPERLEVVEEMPRTPSGKVQKFRLRQMAAHSG